MDQKARYNVLFGPSIAAEDVVGKDAALLLWLVMLVRCAVGAEPWRARVCTTSATEIMKRSGIKIRPGLPPTGPQRPRCSLGWAEQATGCSGTAVCGFHDRGS
jgi:hypothetical protein